MFRSNRSLIRRNSLTELTWLLVDLALSQVAGEYGSSREPHIIDAKCQNMRVIIEKVHR